MGCGGYRSVHTGGLGLPEGGGPSRGEHALVGEGGGTDPSSIASRITVTSPCHVNAAAARACETRAHVEGAAARGWEESHDQRNQHTQRELSAWHDIIKCLPAVIASIGHIVPAAEKRAPARLAPRCGAGPRQGAGAPRKYAGTPRDAKQAVCAVLPSGARRPRSQACVGAWARARARACVCCGAGAKSGERLHGSPGHCV